MNFETIIESKNKLTSVAQTENGDFYNNTQRWLNLIYSPFKSTNQDGAFFLIFYSQIQKHLGLAFLSSIRKHQIQALMCLRQVLESTAIALYLLSFNFEQYEKAKKEKPDFLQSDGLKEQAYKWLASNFPDASNAIKERKKHINQSCSHANATYAFQNFDIKNFETSKKIRMNFFDESHEMTVKANLFFIGDIAKTTIDSTYGVNKKYPRLIFIDNYTNLFKEIDKKHKELQLEAQKQFLMQKK